MKTKKSLNICLISPSSIIIFDPNGEITDFNPKAQEMFEYLPNNDFLSNTSKDIVELFKHARSSVLNLHENFTIEYSYPSKKGDRWYSTHIYPEFDPAGNINTIVEITRHSCG